MQYKTLIPVVALAATASAGTGATEFNLMPDYVASMPGVTIVNRCSYDVTLWSVLKGQGCPSTDGVVLSTGDKYQENYRDSDSGGVSLKLSKTSQCEIGSLLQLEYFIDSSASYGGNYCDVSYVDCGNEDCPTKSEGYYLKVGSQIGDFKASSDNEHCPVMSCSNAEECATMSYINPDDTQTKYCAASQNMNYYLCGGEAPGDDSSDDTSSAAPSSAAPSSTEEASSTPAPSSTQVKSHHWSAPVSSAVEVEAAAITSAPAAPVNVKTEVVYVTQYEYVNAKRHAHGHRHQHFRA